MRNKDIQAIYQFAKKQRIIIRKSEDDFKSLYYDKILNDNSNDAETIGNYIGETLASLNEANNNLERLLSYLDQTDIVRG